MKSRTPGKNALIIFIPDFETEARGFVQENLQYRERYQNFYMLPVPDKSTLESTNNLDAQINELLEKENLNPVNTDCILIRKKGAVDTSEKTEDECYGNPVLKLVKKFKKHFVTVTYNHFLGEKKFSSLGKFRKHQRYQTSQGFPKSVVGQVPLFGSAHTNGKTGWRFFNICKTVATPPYQYLLLPGMQTRVNVPVPFDAKTKIAYQEAIEKDFELRQKKAGLILRRSEHDYADPVCVAEKLGNLFHAYAHASLPFTTRSHRELADSIATVLYENVDWELGECLNAIKSSVEGYQKPIDVRGTFQGLLLEILRLTQNKCFPLLGTKLENTWPEKIGALKKWINESDNDEMKKNASEILDEIELLEKNGKPHAFLQKAVESTLDVLSNPSQTSYQNQYRVARELGEHSWGRKLSGLLLILLGLSLGVGLSLAVYFSGGIAAAISAPVVIKGVTLSATLINAGAAALSGTAAASLPLIASGICLFGKTPLQKKMERVVQVQQNSLAI
jgi:hypothetical protein